MKLEDDNFEAFIQDMREKMAKHGWVIHTVIDDDTCPHNTNIHTHGLVEHFGHLDLQICFPLDPQIAGLILRNFVERIKAGESFAAGDAVREILDGEFVVGVIKAVECGRDVLRVIIPDKDNSIDPAMMDPAFAEQHKVRHET